MENSQYQKWVNISFVVLAGLVGYLLFSAGQHVAGAYDLEARVKNINLILQGGAIVLAGIVFFILYRHDEANQFMNEVATELARVTWPTQKETSNGTVIVIVMVLASGMILGLFDYIWTHLLQMIL
jgi:preprotein translocase subunit SecE